MQYQKQIQKDNTMYLIVTGLNKYQNQDVNNLCVYQYKNNSNFDFCAQQLLLQWMWPAATFWTLH